MKVAILDTTKGKKTYATIYFDLGLARRDMEKVKGGNLKLKLSIL